MTVQVTSQLAGSFVVDGTPIRSTGSAWPGTEGEVRDILGALALPVRFLEPFRVVLVQGVLDGAPACLTSAGTVVIGAAFESPRTRLEDLAWQLCHELGHLFDLRYLGNSAWGLAYRSIRRRLDPPERYGGHWPEWPAEDFRLLFGPPEARVAPHKMLDAQRGITPEAVAADLPEIRGLMQAAVLARARPPANRRVVLTIGSRHARVSEGPGTARILEMDVAPHISAGRTWLPVRWVAEALGCRVDWYPPETVVLEEQDR
ncbi:MAG: copper amine oxidase N-terminal domain-containing protein [bacterium]|nr:copper amine oxidase N-terminal domain-containing protein [bacterium]